MTRDLDKLRNKTQTDIVAAESRKSTRKGNTSPITNCDRGKLEKQCIFCKKQKYLKNSKTSLFSCTTFSTDEKITRASAIRKDTELILLTADDLIAKEAHYRRTCYRSCTLVIYTQTEDNNDTIEEEEYDDEEAFEIVKQKLIELYNSPDVQFAVISDIYIYIYTLPPSV